MFLFLHLLLLCVFFPVCYPFAMSVFYRIIVHCLCGIHIVFVFWIGVLCMWFLEFLLFCSFVVFSLLLKISCIYYSNKECSGCGSVCQSWWSKL